MIENILKRLKSRKIKFSVAMKLYIVYSYHFSFYRGSHVAQGQQADGNLEKL